MADEPTQVVDDAGPPAEERAVAQPANGREPVWQMPALVLAAVLLVSGLYTAVRNAPPNDFDGAFDDVSRQMANDQYEEAIGRLDEIYGSLSNGATEAQQARFYLLRGDAIFGRQRQVGVYKPEYDRIIIDDYRRAHDLGAELDTKRRDNLARTLTRIGRVDEALDLVDRFPQDAAGRRHRVYIDLIEENLEDPDADPADVMAWLTRFQRDETTPPEMRLWIYARRAEEVIRQGYPDDAVSMLLRSIQRSEAEGASNTGELFGLLGRAYVDLGDFASAEKQLRRAETLLPAGTDLAARVQVLLGQIEQARENLVVARDHFTVVERDYSGTPSIDAALLGLAEVDAAQGRWDMALQRYRDLVARFTSPAGPPGSHLTADEIRDSLMMHHQQLTLVEDYVRALELIELAEEVAGGRDAPHEIVLELADSYRRLAESVLDEATDGSTLPDRILDVPAPIRRIIRGHFHDAGESYIRHARVIALEDNFSYGESLWAAGDAYDRAGDQDLAIEAFLEYLQSRDKDVREPAARLRLGRIYQARGDYKAALQYYEGLITGSHANSQEARASYVPMAQCLLQIDPVGNYQRAKDALMKVLQGESLSPDAREFRDALVELALIHYRAGEYPSAVERFEEFLARYPDDRLIDELRFKLANSYRLEAKNIQESLEDAMPQTERDLLESTHNDYLRLGSQQYDMVRDALAAVDPAHRTPIENTMLRDAFFYHADCAFDLGDYEEAIDRYNIAIAQYGDEPTALVASVQVVNSFVAMGKLKEARTAQEAAKLRLQSLPDAAFENDGHQLMTRAQWEAWLDSIMVIREQQQVSQAGS
jgi:tetratricopeptide (TPR) repeat protein